ncbi:DUF3376 domain-containing protein, partial [Kocuria sp. NPDC057446]|uniref:DUF3376 domain-containing protein n=1 Tax=Kocuria sp. NPDC057446 TaxID=3346137 RepID=UPI0036964C5F
AVDLPPLLAAAGIPGAVSRVAYGEIRGDQAPAAPEAFPALRDAIARDRLQQALDAAGSGLPEPGRTRPDGTDRVPARTKLAGAGLLNFRGFLAGDWRANDWWWGRLDAAAGVAEFLRGLPAPAERTAREPEGPAHSREGPPPVERVPAADPVVAGLQEALLRDVGRGSAARGRAAVGASADGLDRLAPGHRLSMASRGVRVLGRALAGTPDLPRPVWEVVLLVLQPLLVLAPAVVTPVRAALVAVVLTAGLWAAGGPAAADAPAGWWTGAALPVAATAVLVLWLLRTARRARRRWAAVLETAGAVGPPPRAADASAGGTAAPGTALEVAAARRVALRRAALLGAAALFLLLPLWAAGTSGRTAVALLLVLTALVLERLAAVVAVRVPNGRGPDELGRAGLVVTAAVAVWAGAALTGLPAQVPDGAGPRAIALGLALLVVGALLLTGWLRPGRAPGIAVAAALLGGAAAWALWSWAGGPGAFRADLPALAGAVYAWAAVLWWAPSERMLRHHGPGEELLPRP